MQNNSFSRFLPIRSVLGRRPDAFAKIKGGSKYPEILGTVSLYQIGVGVIVCAQIIGLPSSDEECKEKILAFHIHSGGECAGDDKDEFSKALKHYNPENCEHPYHAGDLPPLFSNAGRALSIFLTDRFSVGDVIGKTFIIHDSFDDFVTQPSGNSGNKIACGVIEKGCCAK